MTRQRGGPRADHPSAAIPRWGFWLLLTRPGQSPYLPATLLPQGLPMWFQTPTPRRLLIVRNDRVGDLLLTLPAIEAARRNWPAACLAVLASPVAASLLKDYPGIDQLLVDDP